MKSSLTEVSYNFALVQTVQQAMSQVRVIIVPDQSKYQWYEGVKIYFLGFKQTWFTIKNINILESHIKEIQGNEQ